MRTTLRIFVALLFFGCNRHHSDWKSEPVDKVHVDWSGSWPNGIEKLKLISHEWKSYEEEGKYSWAFRAIIAYPANFKDDSSMSQGIKDGNVWASSPYVIPVNVLVFKVYDEDDFLIDSAIVQSQDVLYKDSNTVQFKKEIEKGKLAKIKYGKTQIQAGYFLKNNGNVKIENILIRPMTNLADGSIVIDPKTGERVYEEIENAVNKSATYPTGKYPTIVYLNIGRRDPNSGKVIKEKIPSWEETEEISSKKK